MAPAKAPVLGKTTKADLPAAVFGEEFHESSSTRRRAPTSPPGAAARRPRSAAARSR